MSSVVLQAVPFVHPGLAGIALATGLVPIVIHFINRRRYRRVVWAAMPFLLAASKQSATRCRLEHWLLMLTRILLITLLGLAIARPYVPATALSPLAATRAHRVILLDNSLSMRAAGADGRTRYEIATRCAADLITSFPETDAISLVTLAEPAEVLIGHAAYDRRLVRERLASVASTQRPADIVGAAAKTVEILSNSDAAQHNRMVYVISDFSRRDWLVEGGRENSHESTGAAAARPPAAQAMQRVADALEDPATDFSFLQVASDRTGNVAVTRFEVESPLVAVDLPVRIVAEVTNFGVASAAGLFLQVRHGDDIVRRQSLPVIKPQESALAVLSLEFAAPGTHALEAAVVPTGKRFDATRDLNVLTDDDRRFLSVEVREATRVLLVDGRPGISLLAGEAGFLATALSPMQAASFDGRFAAESARLEATTLIESKVITTAEFAGEPLPHYDVVALCNVARLLEREWEHLAAFVRKGGGLFVFSGDQVSLRNYNRFGHADGGGLLPATFTDTGASTSSASNRLGFAIARHNHPIVAEIADHPDSGLFLARVDRYSPLDFDGRRGEVVLQYTDGKPALLASRFGDGRVLLFTTTANMRWHNLPAKGDYVSLMVNSVAFLAPRHGMHRNIQVGQLISETLTPRQSVSTIHVRTGVAGVPSQGRLVPSEESLAFEYGPVDRAGLYDLDLGDVVRSFAVNVDPHESDLRTVNQHQLVQAMDRPVNVIDIASTVVGEPITPKSSELASPGLMAVIALLLVEMMLAMWFGSRRAEQVSVPSHR